jgi:hypothetical protein
MKTKYHFIRLLKYTLLTFLLVGFSFLGAIAWINKAPVKSPNLPEMLAANEYYEYDVRYGFLKLGNVYVSISDTLYKNEPHHLVTATMISNNNLPFVGYKEYRFNSISKALGDSTMQTQYFWVDKVHRDTYPYNDYTFDYDKGLIYSFEHPEKRDTLQLKDITFGGPELILFSRLHSGANNVHVYPVAIDNEVRLVTSTYTTQIQTIRSQFHGERIEAFRTDGFADLNGPFGFSGNFQGFSVNDELRLPVETKLNVWIGNATIRLTHFEKRN